MTLTSREIRNKNPIDSLVDCIEMDLNLSTSYVSMLNHTINDILNGSSEKKIEETRKKLDSLFFDIYNRIKDNRVCDSDLRTMYLTYEKLFSEVLEAIASNTSYQGIIKKYKLETFFEGLIYINLSHNALINEHYALALTFYKKYLEKNTTFTQHRGFSHHEIHEQGWRRSDRADNEQKNKLKSEGRELAKQIIVIDSKKQNILTLLDIGEIIHDYLSYLYPAEKISEANQIRKKWLTGVKSVSKGRPKGNTDKRDYKLEILEILKQSKK